MPEPSFQKRPVPRVPREENVQQGYELPCESLTVEGAQVRLFTVPETAPGLEQTVLCLPGLGASGRSFAPMRTLSNRYRFLFWTPPLDSPLNQPPLHFNVRALESAKQLPSRFALLGSSYGSLVALDFALQRPERVSALILVSPVASNHRLRNGALLAHKAMQVPLPFAYLFAPAVARVLGGNDLPDVARAEFVREARRITPREMSRRLKDILDTDLMPQLHTLRMPVLVVHGDRDHVVPLQAAKEVANAIPHAELSIIQGAAHLPYMSHPDVFNALVDGFLTRWLSPPRSS